MALVSEYGFNEASGATVAADSSGNGRNITVTAGKLGVAGHAGNGLAASQAGTGVALGPGALTSRTVMCWVKMNTGFGTGSVIAGSATQGAQTTGNEVLYVTNTGRVGRYDSGAGLDVPGATTTIVAGTWYHLAWSTGTSGLVIYVNGVSEITNATTRSYGLDARNLGHDAGANLLNGTVDDLRVYDTQLTAAQITTAMNTPAVALAFRVRRVGKRR